MRLPRFSLRLPDEPWRRNRLAIQIAAGLVFSGFTFVMPFLPLYVREIGVEGEANAASWAGILITIAPLIASLLAPVWGRLADRYGMKLMVERAALAMAVHWGLFGFARSTYQLLGLRVLLGLFGGFATLSMPLLVATTPKEHRSRSIGTLQTVQMVSAAAGPIVGGLLADWIGIRKTCVLSSAAGLAALLLIHSLYREDRGAAMKRPPGEDPKRSSLRRALRLPSFGAMVCIMFLVSLVERSFAPIVPLLVLSIGTELAHAAKVAGLIISMGLLSEGVSAALMGHRLRRSPARRLLLWRLGGGALACFPMGLVSTTFQLLGLRVLLGLLAGGCIVIVYTLGSEIIPEETRATSFAFLAGAGLLGGALGPVTSGFLAHLDIRAIFFVNSLIFGVLLAVAWKFIKVSRD